VFNGIAKSAGFWHGSKIMISRLFFSLQAQLYNNDGAIEPVCHNQPCQPRRESILVNPMSRWCRSIDGEAARDEIKTEIVRQGWHQLRKSSSTANKAIAVGQKRDFVSYLALTYPTAVKDAPSWLAFIKSTMGCLKEWNSVSSTVTEGRQVTVHCVCVCMMALVCGAVCATRSLLTIVSGCAGSLMSEPLVARKRQAES